MMTTRGLGFRPAIALDIINHPNPPFEFIEAHSENYFQPHSRNRYLLNQACERFDLSLHGVGLSLGSDEALSAHHLKALKTLCQELKPRFISEHLSWSHINHTHFNDLLPLPYTDASLALMSAHVAQIQHELGQQLLIENPSAYVQFKGNTFEEYAFLTQLCKNTGCALLIDLNNIFVSACNLHPHSPMQWAQQYIDKLPINAIAELHLAGHSIKHIDGKTLRIDSHNQRVCSEVWQLYHDLLARQSKNIPSLLEWDSDFPAFDVLEQELALMAKHAASSRMNYA